ncbi:MAG: PemK family transcriptional regulator [Nanoarchaeota archaeon]|nr:PemK family transcriptional regulator [Nanoarchaeota archaeon]
MKIKRGDVLLVNLEPVIGSEQGRIRPVLVIQNNISNENSPTTIIAPFTSKIYSKEFPTNVQVSPSESKLDKESTILLNQIRTIDKSRIIKKISSLPLHIITKVNFAIKKSLDLY